MKIILQIKRRFEKWMTPYNCGCNFMLTLNFVNSPFNFQVYHKLTLNFVKTAVSSLIS